MQYMHFFWHKLILAIGIAVIGYFIFRLLIKRLLHVIDRKMPVRISNILGYFLWYGFYLLLIVVVLETAGVDLSAFLAAAGIVGIAIGFAAQTSLSNIISGIMLLIEQSFKPGDLIHCEGLEGHVETIGLLSITLRTPDNRLVRVPNERLMKDNMINITTLGQRMLSFIVTVDSKENGEEVRQFLEKTVQTIAQRIPEKPLIVAFWGSSLQPLFSTPALMQTIHFKVQFWVQVSDIVDAKSAFTKACLEGAYMQKPPLLLALVQE